jgi:hypothetical protein
MRERMIRRSETSNPRLHEYCLYGVFRDRIVAREGPTSGTATTGGAGETILEPLFDEHTIGGLTDIAIRNDSRISLTTDAAKWTPAMIMIAEATVTSGCRAEFIVAPSL